MFRNIIFWENPETDSYEVYPNPLWGWWFHIRRATASDLDIPASGYIVEAWNYGTLIPHYLLTDHAWLNAAPLVELICCIAVLATEQTSPKNLFEGHDVELQRIRLRVAAWLKNPPEWVKAIMPSEMSNSDLQ
jgi:hypothetical protein